MFNSKEDDDRGEKCICCQQKLLFEAVNHVLHGWFHINHCVNPCCGLRKTNKNV